MERHDIPKHRWQKWVIYGLVCAALGTLGFCCLFVFFEPTGVDAEVYDLIEELKGNPPSYIEDKIQWMGLGFLLKKKPEPREDKWEIAEDLIKIGKPAVGKLIETLKYENPDVCIYAASSLGQIDDARVVDPLIMALNDEDA